MPDQARVRILDAVIDCLGRYGIAKTTVDDAARSAGMSRATIYRHFPDGKDQLISEAIARAVEIFFTDLAVAVDDSADFATLFERALLFAHRAVVEHAVLQKVAQTEPERLMPQLSESAPLVQAAVRDYLAEKLRHESLAEGLSPEEAAEWLSRMGISFVFTGGCWDLSDPAEVRHLVRQELLVGILASPT